MYLWACRHATGCMHSCVHGSMSSFCVRVSMSSFRVALLDLAVNDGRFVSVGSSKSGLVGGRRHRTVSCSCLLLALVDVSLCWFLVVDGLFVPL